MDEAISGLKQRLKAMTFDHFEVKEAELGAVLELIRTKITEEQNGEAPSFTLRFPRDQLSRKVSFSLDHAPCLYVLNTLTQMTGLEMRFDRYSLIFAPAPLSH